MGRELRIFTGHANQDLGARIARFLDVPLGRAHLSRFADGETWFQIADNVRGADVFVVQPTCPPVNENLMELLVMLDAFKRSSASRITAVIPYYGYARQDRKDKPRVPITAKLVADLLSAAGTDRILTMDLHASAIQGFFDVPVDHLFAAPVIIDHVAQMGLEDLCVVSPDAGGVERARAPALLMASCTHPVLSGQAVDRIEKSPISKLLVTDSIPLSPEKRSPKIAVLPIAELLAKAIRNIHEESSVTSLFV